MRMSEFENVQICRCANDRITANLERSFITARAVIRNLTFVIAYW